MPLTRADRVRDVYRALSLLTPFDIVGVQKERIGRSGDGGYVLLKLEPQPTTLYSFGIGPEITFEYVLAERGMICHMFDHTIDAPPYSHPNFRYCKEGVAAMDDPSGPLGTIAGFLKRYGDEHRTDMLLKIDVEGEEYSILEALDEANFGCFTQIALELHWTRNLADPAFTDRFIAIFEKLNRHFTLYHVHANNYLPLMFIEGHPVADVLELSYVRTDLVTRVPSRTIYPTALDCANEPERADTPLFFFPFYPAPPAGQRGAEESLRSMVASVDYSDQLQAENGLAPEDHRQALFQRPIHASEPASSRSMPPSRLRPQQEGTGGTVSDTVRGIHLALSLLRPFDLVGIDKIRIGRSADGGQVLADIDLPPTQSFIFTNGEVITFEVELGLRGSRCCLFNHPVGHLPNPHPNLTFITVPSSPPEQPMPSISEVIAAHDDGRPGPWLLKLSSAGGELAALTSLGAAQRRRLSHIIVQVHWLSRLGDPNFRQAFIAAVEDINRDFTLYHVHGNNHLNLAMVENFPVVDVIELTYVRTELVRRKASQTAYPTYLDCASDPERPDLVLSFFPFHPSPAALPEAESEMVLGDSLISCELIDRLRRTTTLPTTSLRTAAAGRIPLAPAARVLHPPQRRRVPPGGRLNILYFGCHETLDYDDLSMFTSMGHTVFDVGAFADPNIPVRPATRPVKPQFYSRELWDAFVADPGNDLLKKIVTPGFTALFDLVIVNHDPNLLDVNRAALAGMPIVFRSIGQATDGLEACLARHIDHVTVVRYSPREVGLPTFCPSDRVIYFAKDLDEYPEWIPGGDRMITFHNGYPQRSGNSVPTLASYLALAEKGPLDLYGYLNEGTVPWRGLAPAAMQQHLFRTAGVYFYVYSAPPSYTLSLIEALLMGVPTVVPSAAAVRRAIGSDIADMVTWMEQRYEVEDFVGNDPALIWDTPEEGYEKAQALLKDQSLALNVSKRLRARASSLFDYRTVSGEWQALFDEMIKS